nr:unnamed protein product [Spirometra erinaceieuropaei]
MLSAMLMDAYCDDCPGISIAYRTVGNLPNSRRMQAPARLSTAIIRDLPFAGDCALITKTNMGVQRSIDLFHIGCTNFGLTTNKNETVDWFDDNNAVISNLLAEKNRLQKAYVDHPTDDNRAAFYCGRRHFQQRLREMQDAWTARKADEIQGYADRNEWKNFSAIKALYDPPTKGTAPLLSADGITLLTEKTQILQRWAEHFGGVLNRHSAISDAAIHRLPEVETNVDLDLPSSLQETIRAMQQFSSGNAPRSDAIPAEVYKHGGPQLMDHLTALFQEMWRQVDVLQNFQDVIIVVIVGPRI